MRITRSHTVFQLTFMPRLFPVNCYLVEESNGLTLIDAALPYSAKRILGAARKIGKPITRIVLTHAHGDHVGALDALKATLGDVPVHISRRDARLLQGDVTLDPGEPNTPVRGDVPKNVATRADVLLSEGDRVGSLMALAAPGHTPGSMAFMDVRNKALIAGDAFQTRGGFAITGQLRPLFPFPTLATWHREVALASARKLAAQRPSLIAVGHGPMLAEPAARLERAIARAATQLGLTQPNGAG
ncbi:MAG TPA: MBL fold metallo-hydrolase [Limnochordia bacterium]|nr:MBL fold metallo-hydrolase [Limnochordia bacterium]